MSRINPEQDNVNKRYADEDIRHQNTTIAIFKQLLRNRGQPYELGRRRQPYIDAIIAWQNAHPINDHNSAPATIIREFDANNGNRRNINRDSINIDDIIRDDDHNGQPGHNAADEPQIDDIIRYPQVPENPAAESVAQQRRQYVAELKRKNQELERQIHALEAQVRAKESVTESETNEYSVDEPDEEEKDDEETNDMTKENWKAWNKLDTTFSGDPNENIVEFLEEIELFASVNKISDKQKYNKLVTQLLKKKAKKEFMRARSKIKTYKQLKAFLYRNNDGKHEVDIRKNAIISFKQKRDEKPSRALERYKLLVYDYKTEIKFAINQGVSKNDIAQMSSQDLFNNFISNLLPITQDVVWKQHTLSNKERKLSSLSKIVETADKLLFGGLGKKSIK